MVTGRKEFRRTTSLTEITLNLPAAKPSQNEHKKKSDEAESSLGGAESPREYTRRRRRSINIPAPQNYYNTHDNPASFLTTCGLCQRRLPPARDIFMYRGDTAYCSVDCREEQMEHDERKEQCSSITQSPPPSVEKDDDVFCLKILEHSLGACSISSDPAAAKPGTFAAA